MARHRTSHPRGRRGRPGQRPGVRPSSVAALATVAALITGCGGDDDASAAVTTAPVVTPAEPTDASTVEIVAADYRFEGVPSSVPTGTRFTFTNTSSVELHELIVIRIPDDEERSVPAILELPEAELDALFDDEELLATVIVAPPGEEGVAVVGDGTVTEPGRYALFCFVPTGVDAAEFLAAAEAAEGGPPDIEGGPPHVAHGMFAEVLVTG